MSAKNEKKHRQLVRRLFGREARQLAEVMAEKNERLLKPKPRWIPDFVWIWLLSFFIYIKK